MSDTRKKVSGNRPGSNLGDLLDLMDKVYEDACLQSAAIPDSRNLIYIRARVRDEGLSFLTITLPNFCRDFERSLARGYVSLKDFRSFRKSRAIPVFLRGMLRLIFNEQTGVLYDPPSSLSVDPGAVVAAIRQICRCFTKLQVSCTPQRVQEAIEGFSSLEDTLSRSSVHPDDMRDFDRVSRLLWDPILAGFDPAKSDPNHGPGATATMISGNQKFRMAEWHERLETLFPLLGYGFPLGAALEEEFESISFVLPKDEKPSRVIPVPKTLKGPRIIAAEPLSAQFVQQAIRSFLYERIESRWPTKTRVNFRDQSINQALALMGSTTGELATLDLSDASDRVSHALSMMMFSGNPLLAEAIEACRTTHAVLPDGRVIGPLQKFASMGSALCFPVESMCFYTICIATLLRGLRLPFNKTSISMVADLVHVYGDDLIVPANVAAAITVSLAKHNCKVNVHKSFWTGKFRESCGTDAYDGQVVTPTYVRQLIPSDRSDHSRIVSVLATANAFYLKGYWQTAQFLFDKIERVLGRLPIVSQNSPALGRISVLPHRSTGRYNDDLQREEVLAWVAEPVYRTDRLEGYAALCKSLFALERRDDLDVERDPLHLERSARRGVVALKRRWVGIT